MQKSKLWAIIGISAAILILGIVGENDFNDQIEQGRAYCERIEQGIHGHYLDGVKCIRGNLSRQ